MDTRINPRTFFAVLGVALFLFVAIAIPIGLVGPTKPDTKGYDAATKAALADADANNATAEGAPQQAVVNGWLARDLTEIQINQNNDELVLLHLVVSVLVAALLAVVVAGVWAAAAASRVSPVTLGNVSPGDSVQPGVSPAPTPAAARPEVERDLVDLREVATILGIPDNVNEAGRRMTRAGAPKEVGRDARRGSLWDRSAVEVWAAQPDE